MVVGREMLAPGLVSATRPGESMQRRRQGSEGKMTKAPNPTVVLLRPEPERPRRPELSEETRIETEPPETPDGSELLSVSAAARMLGVSPSSLRAWAAAGRVPHRRTQGGHRRFEFDALVAWLAERGGGPPTEKSGPQELVPTRVPQMKELAAAIRAGKVDIVNDFEAELQRGRSGSQRGSATRRSRVRGTLDVLAESLEVGDLSPAFREAEWEGFRNGAAGSGGDAPVTEALALRRAVDRVIVEQTDSSESARRTVQRALDRLVVRVASGYADGVQARMRSTAGEQ